MSPDGSNYDLKEEIRAYWSRRAETFDASPGHGIRAGAEHAAWQALLGPRLAPDGAPRRVLELGSGTGEVTRVLLSLGHSVTGLDLAEPMLERARLKHAGSGGRARFFAGDAEATQEPDARYDAVVCRHLVWTLTYPDRAFREWLRVLKPGGRVVIVDGDWQNPPLRGRLCRLALRLLDRLTGGPPADPGLDHATHEAIQSRLPLRDDLSPARLRRMLEAAGFAGFDAAGLGPVRRAQTRGATLRTRLRFGQWEAFVATAEKPGGERPAATCEISLPGAGQAGSHSLYSRSRRLWRAQVAQLVEHVTENHGVGGSIPPLGTNTAHPFRKAPSEI